MREKDQSRDAMSRLRASYLLPRIPKGAVEDDESPAWWNRAFAGMTFKACLALSLLYFAVDASSSDAGAGETRPRLAILPIKLLDTSGEPQSQETTHARRLDAMAAALAADPGAATTYRTTRLGAEDLRLCTGGDAGCLLDAARASGAGFVLVGVVHKSSTLILQMWVRIVDLRTNREHFSRDLNFRGDTDDAWHRAEVFLIDQIRSLPPRP